MNKRGALASQWSSGSLSGLASTCAPARHCSVLHPLSTRVTHTYDWTQLTDESRISRAQETTPDRLQESLDRLAALAESR
jgi:hypothetical protein